MRFFLQTLLVIAALLAGFMAGLRYQERVERLDETLALVQVQKAKIEQLKERALLLRTEARLRAYLSDVRMRLPNDTVGDMASLIFEVARRYEVSPEMILAVIRIESSFDANALSHKGAVGLMQILPSTAQEIARELRMEWPGEEILRDPSANIEMGTYYLTKLLGRFNDLSIALAAYNHGPSRVADLASTEAGVPMDYTQKVLRYYSP
jgi:soluble lytic murein transglycosylase